MMLVKLLKRSSSKNDVKKEKRSVSFNSPLSDSHNQDGQSSPTTSSRYVLTRKNTSLFDLHASDGNEDKNESLSSSTTLTTSSSTKTCKINNDNNDINYINNSGICYINKLPYDVLAIILEKVHNNRILTKQFCNISLVCIHWRKLTRINGQLIPLDSFFKRIENIKMKPDVIEHCMNYFNYIYPGLEDIEIGKHSINNRIFSKNAIYFIQNMDKVSQVEINMDKVNPAELELLLSELKAKKTIKKLIINNCTGTHFSIVLDLVQSLSGVTHLVMNHVAFDTPKDHQAFVHLFQHNRTITELYFSFVPTQSTLVNSHYIKTIKTVLAVTQSLLKVTFEKSNQTAPIVNNKKQQAAQMAAQQAQHQSFENLASSLSEEDLAKYTTMYNNNKSSATVTNVVLRNIDLTDNDLLDLAPFFNADSIQSIDLSYNKSLSSIEPLMKSLISSSATTSTNGRSNSLTRLNLSGLAIDSKTSSMIGQYINTNKSLSSVILNDCNNTTITSALSNVTLVPQPTGISSC
ncbi:hypothetical protein CYY_001057 [Polysphondylium violaceum]|uniref:F-box domain-containing protein n=1 Tax=Polysphondylium violaceum TaxID=133409 RepID=A0A8J4VAZ4_9MYCE|nr:hypothetical protein CYY_001057 [Polysphondylium violaceum]